MSLQLRAVLITGVALMVLWGAVAVWMLQGMRTNLDSTLDGRLAMSARMVSGLLKGSVLDPKTLPANFTNAIRVSGNNGIVCEIRTLSGDVLARTSRHPSANFSLLSAGYSTREIRNSLWRVYVLRANGYQITTADRIDERSILIDELLRAVGVPFMIAFFGGLGALWIGIGRGLVPLKALREKLRVKEIDDTSPIAIDHAPTELRPVLDAMNDLLGRLAHALSSQRAFTDAAAHELRTPLTIIDTHLQVVRLSEGQEAQASLSDAEEGVRRLRHTLDQMMTLARTEASTDKGDDCASVLTVINGVFNQVGEDERSRLTLLVDNADSGTPIPKFMLKAVVRNLVDNAMRYSPKDSIVEVNVRFNNSTHRCCLTVSDRGPGLSREQASQIGRRFWRGDQGRQRKDGSGLGISIVRAIVERFDGTLNLNPRKGGGLIAEIIIPIS